MKDKSTTIKVPDFVEFRIYPFSMDKEYFSSKEYVRNLRDKTWRRYDEEISNALDFLFKKPKKEWPKLLRK